MRYAGSEKEMKGALFHSFIDDEPMSHDLGQHSSNSQTQGDAVWSALAEEYGGTEEHHQEAAARYSTGNVQTQSAPRKENMTHEAVAQHTDSSDEQTDTPGSPVQTDVAMTEDPLSVLDGTETPPEEHVLPAKMVRSMLGNKFFFSRTVYLHSQSPFSRISVDSKLDNLLTLQEFEESPPYLAVGTAPSSVLDSIDTSSEGQMPPSDKVSYILCCVSSSICLSGPQFPVGSHPSPLHMCRQRKGKLRQPEPGESLKPPVST